MTKEKTFLQKCLKSYDKKIWYKNKKRGLCLSANI